MPSLLLPLLFAAVLGGLPAAPVANLVRNPSFERDADRDGIPDAWSPAHLGPSDVRVADARHGLSGFQIVGAAGAEKHLLQNLGPAAAGQTFAVAGWSKAQSPSASGGYYAVSLHVFYTDGTEDGIIASFSRSTHDWELVQASGTLTKDASKVLVGLLYYDQTGTAVFDAVRVTRQ